MFAIKGQVKPLCYYKGKPVYIQPLNSLKLCLKVSHLALEQNCKWAIKDQLKQPKLFGQSMHPSFVQWNKYIHLHSHTSTFSSNLRCNKIYFIYQLGNYMMNNNLVWSHRNKVLARNVLLIYRLTRIIEILGVLVNSWLLNIIIDLVIMLLFA